jgi:hypothetical protein
VAIGASAGPRSPANQPFAVGTVALVDGQAPSTTGPGSSLTTAGFAMTNCGLCGLTESEVLAQLRRDGVASVSELRYVLYETKGELTIIREPGDGTPDPELVGIGLRDAADFRQPDHEPPGGRGRLGHWVRRRVKR